MKNLRRGSYGQDVEILQRFLKRRGYYIETDGQYGPATAKAVCWYQKNEKLQADSKFGPSCRESMHKAKYCKYQEFNLDRQTTVIRMDRERTTAKVLNPKRQTLRQMFASLYNKPSLIINGTLFNTRTMADLAHLKVNGKQVGSNYYDDDGLRMDRNGKVSIGLDGDKYHEFMGFSPAIILNGVVNHDRKDLDKGFMNNKHPRTMVQVTNKYINVFIVRGRSLWRRWYGANFNKLVEYSEKMSLYDYTMVETNSGNFDGGGSTGAYTKRGVVHGWVSRGVANGVAFYVDGV